MSRPDEASANATFGFPSAAPSDHGPGNEKPSRVLSLVRVSLARRDVPWFQEIMMISPSKTSPAQDRFHSNGAPSRTAGSLKSADAGGQRAPGLAHTYSAAADVI